MACQPSYGVNVLGPLKINKPFHHLFQWLSKNHLRIFFSFEFKFLIKLNSGKFKQSFGLGSTNVSYST